MRTVLLLLVVGFLAACSTFQTNFGAPLDPAVTRGWRVVDVTVTVPENLVVSEQNTYAPSGDIVWWGDPPGDRKAQVAALLQEAISAGAADLKGPRPVKIAVTLSRFHAITPKTRYTLQNVGVNSIRYYVQVFDARSAAPLTESTFVDADFPAVIGDKALELDARGETEKVLIERHVADVTRDWLGIGPNVENRFRRVGI